MTEQETYEEGIAVETMCSSAGWRILLRELQYLSGEAQVRVHESAQASPEIVKSVVQRWNMIQGFINEIQIRMDGYISRKDSLLIELSQNKDDITDPAMQIAVESLEDIDENDFSY